MGDAKFEMTTTAAASQPTQAPPRPPRQRQRWRRPRRTAEPATQEAQAFSETPGQNAPVGVNPATSGMQQTALPSHQIPPSAPAAIRGPAAGSGEDTSARENNSSRKPRNTGNRARGKNKPKTGNREDASAGQRQPINSSRQFRGAGTRINPGRTFGGNLTVEPSAEPGNVFAELQADAPEFQPGQPVLQRAAKKDQKPRRPEAKATRGSGPVKTSGKRRPSRSTAEDIGTRTHEDIDNANYECPICTNEVARNSKVWSCKTCWTVFHLGCIKKWSRNDDSASAQRQQESGDLPAPRQWRCPGCNLPTEVLPSAYTCWCEKEVDPRSISGLPPHSCGQTCGKPRPLPKKCPHPCDLICHAGPCPPCSHMGPTLSCFCGKEIATRKCLDTNYESGWSCGQICGDLMPCGEHYCERPCHEGLCGACEVRVDARCYCGKVEKPIICCEKGDEKDCKETIFLGDGTTTVDGWTGLFDCEQMCERLFDCGKHKCEKPCHSQEEKPTHCPRSPDIVHLCPCGKTPLTEISEQPRRSCEDKIPNCNKKCLKMLACGHPCQQVCHSDPCLPCLLTVPIACRCGRVLSSTTCHQGTEEPPQCIRICKTALSCGRHECGERCCPGERKAVERQITKKKLRPLNAPPRPFENDFEAEHICTRICGRLLKCGTHTCPELCHKGPCGSCREAIFDEISCNCGRTVLHPPLPCGTKPPPCRFDCERPKLCGHPQVPHNCHGDEESCPRCPFLTEKQCLCGRRALKNQQCWLADVRCGEICGRKLKCGSHFCRKTCHRPGDCEDAGRPCLQACGKPKKTCGHSCEEPCHAPSTCKEDKPCIHKIMVTCDCQRLKQEMKCNASNRDEGNSQKELKCDDECGRLERNRQLALALRIDPEAHQDDHVPYSQDTLSMFQENAKWAPGPEREIRIFAADETQKRLRFKPMPAHQRAFVHSLTQDIGLDSESMDPEPHRHVIVFKTPRFVAAPMKTLSECLRVKPTTLNPSSDSGSRRKQEASQNINRQTPYNGFLMTAPRFGLTIEEISSDLGPLLVDPSGIELEISFLPSEEIALKARSPPALAELTVEANLKSIKSSLAKTVNSKSLAGSIQLCSLDTSLNVLRREADSAGGWSQVAAKAAAPRRAPVLPAVGSARNTFTVLGSRLADAKKKKAEAKAKRTTTEVVDDWEAAEAEEEEKEKTEKDHAEASDAEPTSDVPLLDSSNLSPIDASASPSASAFASTSATPPASEDVTVPVPAAATPAVAAAGPLDVASPADNKEEEGAAPSTPAA
ncbi:hypothetical protein L228DRAFT_252154 [Xylona heveae TC161]|uniref:R3H domain-containing protein n=1 Tax=Xylona heveae (strain CBS 132557 / TC161) TaxID=1328760 RepID=A0A165JYK5_XYLHT|nr:hypothetical protein L228DRAFT_252154 [Xylona heveae TC161]KZF26790.1 hypothetical protein L228DRAFT_252154 [Xylona heveae TC161]